MTLPRLTHVCCVRAEGFPKWHRKQARLAAGALLLAALGADPITSFASNHYTTKQIEAFATRVGQSFWIKSVDGKLPSFRTAPTANAASFGAEDKQSFEIMELTSGVNKNPFYRVKFSSGKEGYISPEALHEELNMTILTADPYADEKRRAELFAKEDKDRVAWIQAQPWSAAVKQAAINKQPVPGLNTVEIRKVLGEPHRIIKLRGPLNMAEERWYYPDGKILTFHNTLLSAVDQQAKK